MVHADAPNTGRLKLNSTQTVELIEVHPHRTPAQQGTPKTPNGSSH